MAGDVPAVDAQAEKPVGEAPAQTPSAPASATSHHRASSLLRSAALAAAEAAHAPLGGRVAPPCTRAWAQPSGGGRRTPSGRAPRSSRRRRTRWPRRTYSAGSRLAAQRTPTVHEQVQAPGPASARRPPRRGLRRCLRDTKRALTGAVTDHPSGSVAVQASAGAASGIVGAEVPAGPPASCGSARPWRRDGSALAPGPQSRPRPSGRPSRPRPSRVAPCRGRPQ